MALGTLTIDLAANTARLSSDLGRATQMSKRYHEDLGRQAQRAGKIVGAALAAGAVAAAAGVAVMVNQQRQAIDAQAKLAQQLRTTYESMANLSRAGDLAGVSMNQIQVAARSLETNLGRAIQGTGAQADAFKRLRLDANELAKVPLDERIKRINQALVENVPAAERAAVAADVFGQRNASAMQMLNADTISEASRQVEIFGLNLSDVDAAKVEMANDAMSTFSMLGDGIAKQLTVEMAPILRAIGDLFLKNAEKAGGMGNVVSNTMTRIVNGAGFVIDAVDGVGRVFTLVTSTAATGIGYVVLGISSLYKAIMELAAKVPGMKGIVAGPISAMEVVSNGARAVIEENKQKIDDALNRPLAGETFKQFVMEAQQAGQAAAEAAVEARKGIEVAAEQGAEVATRAARRVRTEIDKLQQAYDSQLEGYERRLALLNATTEAETLSYEISRGKLVGINAEQQKRLELLAAELDLQAALKKQAEDQQRINTEALQIVDSLKSEEERLAESYEKRRQIILDSTIATEEEKHAILAELDQQRHDTLMQLEAQRMSVVLQNAQQGFDALAGLAETFAGKQSGIYKVMFAASKAFALADAIVKIQAGIANAAVLPFPANLGAMATVAASTAGIVSTISGTEMAGARRYGGAVNAGQLYEVGENNRPELLVAGGRQFMIPGNRGEVIGSDSIGRGSVVNQTINVNGRVDPRTASQMQRSAARQQRIAQSRFG